jgi:hypothetical protein
VALAEIELQQRTAEWQAATKAGDVKTAILKAFAVQSAQQILDAAKAALAKEKAKLDEKQPKNVQPAQDGSAETPLRSGPPSGQECPRSSQIPACLISQINHEHPILIPNYGTRIAADLALSR